MARRSNRRATVTAAVGFGVAELRPDPAHPRAWTLLVDGVPQSYVDLADPAHLRFDYLERLAAVLRSCAPPRVPLEVLHLGGGGLALPRFLDHLRPGSAQRWWNATARWWTWWRGCCRRRPPSRWWWATRGRRWSRPRRRADVCLLADAAVRRGRRAGNAVLVAGDALGGLPGRLSAVHGGELAEFTGGAKARLDEPR